MRGEDYDEVDRCLNVVAAGPAEDAIAFHPGSGWAVKNWPPERWGRLAAELRRMYGIPVLVTGTRVEAELLDEVVREGGGAAVSLAGALSLGGLAALYSRVRLLVATDSGPLHLAAAVGAPVIGLFGPFGPQRARPLAPRERSTTLFHRLPCSPCGTLEHPPCGAVRDPACLAAITVDEVVEAAARIVGQPISEPEPLRRAWSVTA